MKRIIFIMGFLFSLCTLSCQETKGQSGAMTVSGGATLTDADTSYLSATINGKREVTISATVTYTSGTLAGNGRLFVSPDGTNYELWSNTDTMAISSPITYNGVVQKTKSWVIPINYWKYYQVRLITTGTSVGVPSGDYIAR